MKKSAVVIGGGIAGLTAALKLKQAGVEVTLLEKESRLGGAMYSIEKDGYLTEIGPNTILETSPKVTEIVNQLGLKPEKIYANEVAQTRYIVRNKKPVPLPVSPPAFFMSRLFSFSAKLRLLKEPFVNAWENQYDESLSHFVKRRMGQEFLDYAINPFVAGVYAGDPDKLSVKHGFPKLYGLEQEYGSLIKGQIKGAKERKERRGESKQKAKMFSFLRGLKTLPDAFERTLGSVIHKNARVNDISLSEKNWDIAFTDERGLTKRISADSVIYAGQAGELENLTMDQKKVEDFTLFKEIYYPPLSVLALGFRRGDVGHPLDGFGVLIPKIEGFQILGVLFSSTLFPHRAPQGHVLLTVFTGGARQPDNALKNETELIDMSLNDLRILVRVQGKPTFTHHILWEQAIPQYEVGYTKFKDKLEQLEKDYPGLFFTGNYRNGISVPDTIINSIETVDRAVAHIV